MNNADDKSFPLRNIQYLIREALTKTDKAEVKRIAKKEVESELKAKLSAAVKEEVEKALADKATKQEIAEISKSILKKLYKDISMHHPYIIDRIKI
tara:strand:+ start:378 stop:665 length:288 start_codon:yes stop_codon:yes gene_type:complete